MLPMTDPPRQPTKYDMTIFYLRHYDLCRAAERQHGKHYLELSAEQQRALRAVVAAGMESPRNEGSRRKQQVRKERLGKRTAKRDAVKARADIERQRTEFGRLLPNLVFTDEALERYVALEEEQRVRVLRQLKRLDSGIVRGKHHVPKTQPVLFQRDAGRDLRIYFRQEGVPPRTLIRLIGSKATQSADYLRMRF
jgi:hypothetical protein